MVKPATPKEPHTALPVRRVSADDRDPPQSKTLQDMYRDQIREALQAITDRLGHLPTMWEVESLSRYKLLTIENYFGDLQSALKGLDVPQNQLKKLESGLAQTHNNALLPPDVVSRSNFREVTLAAASLRGIVPRNRVEEAFIFQWMGVGSEYFTRYPLHRDVVVREYHDDGPATATRLRKFKTILLKDHSIHSRPIAAYKYNENGNVVAADIFDRPESIPPQWFSVFDPDRVSRISPEEADLNRAKALASSDGVDVATRSTLARYGLDIEHDVERAFLLRFLGVSKLDRKISIKSAREFFSTHKDHAVTRLITLLKIFDSRLVNLGSTDLRVSFRINMANDAISSFSLTPMTATEGWAGDDNLTQLIMRPVNGRWPIHQYHGTLGREWADTVGVFAPNALVPPRHWVARRGAITPSWAELRETLSDPAKRKWLFELLWHSKFPGQPIPEKIFIQASRNGEDDILPAYALDVMESSPELEVDPPNHLARLSLVKFGDHYSLLGFYGRGGLDLAKAVLQGDSHLPEHPLEYALIMGHLCQGNLVSNLKLQDVTEYFSKHGHAGIGRIASDLAAVDSSFPMNANRFAISAWFVGAVGAENKLINAKMWHGEDVVRERARDHTFWVEYERGRDGFWQILPARHFAGQTVEAAGEENGIGVLPLAWPDLKDAMALPGLRRALFHRLWERDHPGESFPKQFIFQSSKHGNSDRPTESMAVLSTHGIGEQKTVKYLAWLWFDDDGKGGVLYHSEGRSANELVESYLSGKGLAFNHVVEKAVALRMFNDDTVKLPEALTPQLLLSYFDQSGKNAILKLIDAMRVAENVPDKLPLVVNLSGQLQQKNGITVSGLRFREGGYHKSETPNSTLFGVEWTLQPDGEYVVTQAVGSLGKKIAAASSTKVEGTVVFAPDADAKDRAAAAVAKYTQVPEGFMPLDENMCRNEPLITPADVVQIEPLVHEPIKVENAVPGFAPTPLTPKDLAIPASTERYAGSVDLPEFVGSDTFLPEPPLGMVIVGDAMLMGGLAIATAAMAVEVPSSVAAGIVRGVQVALNPARPIWVY